MQVVDIFSGIGGFSLAAGWMGWKTVQFCEKESFCQRVLSYYWPGVPISNDIKTLTADQIINNGLYDKSKPTILVGGVPCQPWSTAGKRLGKEDDRDLWEESIKLAKYLQPNWIVFENVRGLTNWNGGMVFDEVQADLEAEGYEVLPFLLPACAVNAPHRRDRIFFIAHAACNGHGNGFRKSGRKKEKEQGEEQWEGWNKKNRERNGSNIKRTNVEGDATNTESKGLERENGIRMEGTIQSSEHTTPNTNKHERPEGGMHEAESKETERYAGTRNARINWRKAWDDFPTQPPVCYGANGFPGLMDSDAIFRTLGVTYPRKPAIGFAKWRNESLKAGGNAVVPQVVYEIFKAIESYETPKDIY